MTRDRGWKLSASEFMVVHMFEELLRYMAPVPAASATPVFDATVRAIPLVYEPADRGTGPVFGPLGRSRPNDVSDIAWSEFEPAGWILDLLAAEHENVSTDIAALEAAAALDQAISFATAVKLRYLAAFARFQPPSTSDAPTPHGEGQVPVSESAGNEVAAALNLSRGAARAQLRLAVNLERRLPSTLGALQAGAIDPVRATAIAETTASLSASAAKAVEAKALSEENRTAARLRALLRRAVIAARRETNLKPPCVHTPRTRPAGVRSALAYRWRAEHSRARCSTGHES